MHPLLILLFALSFAWTWVHVLKLFSKARPFNCVKCMTGWTALIIAVVSNTDYAPMYLFAGLFTGAMYDAIKMRYL